MKKTSHVESRKVIYQELKDAFKGILNSHKYINSLSKKREEIIPSAEWILDNIYLIEKEYKNIKFNIPNGYLDNIDIRIIMYFSFYYILKFPLITWHPAYNF